MRPYSHPPRSPLVLPFRRVVPGSARTTRGFGCNYTIGNELKIERNLAGWGDVIGQAMRYSRHRTEPRPTKGLCHTMSNRPKTAVRKRRERRAHLPGGPGE